MLLKEMRRGKINGAGKSSVSGEDPATLSVKCRTEYKAGGGYERFATEAVARRSSEERATRSWFKDRALKKRTPRSKGNYETRRYALVRDMPLYPWLRAFPRANEQDRSS